MSTKRSDNRYVQSLTDSRTGKRIYFYGKTKAELNKKIMNYKYEKTSSRKFSEVADEWWEDAEPRLEIQTVKSYKPALADVLEYFGNSRIDEITSKSVSECLNRYARSGMAQKTISTRRIILNRIFKYAMVEGYTDTNPVLPVQTPKAPKEKVRAADHKDEQIARENYRVWLFPTIAVYTGMRKGEILALQWNDINFENHLISVTKSVCHDGDKPIIKQPKTEAGNRFVPLLKQLEEILLTQPEHKPTDYIISDDGGKTPLTNRRFETHWSHYKQSTGINCTAHQLRHSMATICNEAGLGAKEIQTIIGHADINTTMNIYTDVRVNTLLAARELLEQYFSKN